MAPVAVPGGVDAPLAGPQVSIDLDAPGAVFHPYFVQVQARHVGTPSHRHQQGVSRELVLLCLHMDAPSILPDPCHHRPGVQVDALFR
jgi:hypothetical protein